MKPALALKIQWHKGDTSYHVMFEIRGIWNMWRVLNKASCPTYHKVPKIKAQVMHYKTNRKRVNERQVCTSVLQVLNYYGILVQGYGTGGMVLVIFHSGVSKIEIRMINIYIKNISTKTAVIALQTVRFIRLPKCPIILQFPQIMESFSSSEYFIFRYPK